MASIQKISWATRQLLVKLSYSTLLCVFHGRNSLDVSTKEPTRRQKLQGGGTLGENMKLRKAHGGVWNRART